MQVPLPNIKRLFRTEYHMELSETVLGHAKLSDLLNDASFRDICTVELQDRGYFVIPVTHQHELCEAATKSHQHGGTAMDGLNSSQRAPMAKVSPWPVVLP